MWSESVGRIENLKISPSLLSHPAFFTRKSRALPSTLYTQTSFLDIALHPANSPSYSTPWIGQRDPPKIEPRFVTVERQDQTSIRKEVCWVFIGHDREVAEDFLYFPHTPSATNGSFGGTSTVKSKGAGRPTLYLFWFPLADGERVGTFKR